MHSIVVSYEKKREAYRLPENWQEVSDYGTGIWWKLTASLLVGKSPQAALWALRALLTMEDSEKVMPFEVFKQLDPVHVKLMSEMLGWMWTEGMTHQPFAAFWHEGVEYYLPDSGLGNVSLIEFAYLDTMYNLYVRMAQEEKPDQAELYLTKLCTYMCRPIDPDINPEDAKTYKGDQREMFNTIICDRRLPSFSRLPIEKKLPLLLFYVGCKREVHERAEGTVFSKMTDEEGNHINGSGRPMEPQEWIDIAFHLAGGKFGTLQETMYTNFFTVLHWLRVQEKF